ncbi:Stress response protein [Fulvia fulva]|uniref:Stress response protein NST1 n=1 Tax=Passalora fulva TaxID=5499 RepID=A0A9Q8PBX1_PASFU|nr:Stress response protein [Fulvia fulva]KAK4620232.1 Stress response protein [Fulvia fulva]KAK4620936.1 Stress response protein [Fulvia fulva]UJO19606.1 Stress response protein [Fulvia fulva]WPV17137.1 Stress response protein [Fulvia fulva]WPV32495.1 Stress response protein [Fulvia fulva]
MSTTKAPAPPANGVITAPPPGNRKKQKRRAKQAAKSASQVPSVPPPPAGYEEDALRYDDEEDDFEEDEPEYYEDEQHDAPPPMPPTNGLHPPPPPVGMKKTKKKHAPALSPHHHHHHHHHHAYDPRMSPPPLPQHAPPPPGMMRPSMRHGHSHDNIWNTTSAQERQNIKEFWLELSEEQRKGLLKIEKEAVLKKMKAQQKHSCSCTVCGRKRTAIEEELEVLYEGYYEELEQYAHHDIPPLPSTDGMIPPPLQQRQHPFAHPPPPMPPQHRTSHLHEHLDEDEFSDEEEEEEYSGDEEDDEPYSDEELDQGPEPEPPRGHPGVPDFFNFGSHLTVKDNLLTVADDLLKNDGRKFIEMMEQLAERRMQRESRSQYEAEHHAGYPPDENSYSHEDPLATEEYDDDDASYDSQDDFDDEMEEEDEMVSHRELEMASRRMFQIFAARMFEQRVLTAYREKVATERQMKLLEEIDNEDKLQAQREAKKQRDAQKKKDKKKQQAQAKAEEKAKRDAEKAEEERQLREAEEKKQEDQRRRREEQRKKREEEKKKQEEEKARKEAERLRRQQEEQQRREEAERKAREQKAAEKAKKDEARKKEREEREAREKEARERKAQEEKDKREREAKAKAEKEAKEREKSAQQAASAPHPPQITKRPSQAGMVAIPGVFPKQTQSGISSPHPQVATPAIPKAPTPAKHRQASQQRGSSHASSPRQSNSLPSGAPSKSSSPGSVGQQQNQVQPKTIMQKPSNHQAGQQQPPHIPASYPLPQQHIQPPPGMAHPQQHHGGFGHMSPMAFPAFPGPQGPFAPSMGQRGPMPMFPPHQGPPPMGLPNRMPFGAPGMNGMAPPPGMIPPPMRGFPYDAPGQAPPGFGQALHHNQTSPLGPSPGASGGDAPRTSISGHSRQQSSEKERFESAANQPIARPAPIQRPSSVRPPGAERTTLNAEVDAMSQHLGSSALLDDTEEQMLPGMQDSRRHSQIPAGSRGIPIPNAGMHPTGGFGGPNGGFGTPGSTWNTPAMPFGSSPGLQSNWGSLPNPGMGGWMNNNFAPNGFGSMAPGVMNGRAPGLSQPRPLVIRQEICKACQQLSNASRGEGDGYNKVDVLLQQVENNHPPLDAPITLQEVEDICETEGDSHNGGGELSLRRDDDGNVEVKWEDHASTPDQGRGSMGLGEIGSPMPSKTSPAVGFGAPGMPRAFGSLGAVGNPNV